MSNKREFVYNFNGFSGTPSRCHIRILDDEEKPLVVVCSQMAVSPGTSVTNHAEFIASDVRQYLERGNITLVDAIQNYLKKSRLTRILDDLVSRLKDSKNITVFALESIKLALEYQERYKSRAGKLRELVWVEHYAASLGLGSNGSYAVVTFDEDSWTPDWQYVHLDALEKKTGYQQSDFEIPIDELRKD